MNQRKQFPSELLLAFTVPWWTTGGVRYGSPDCTVVVGSYSSFLPSAWYAWLWEFKCKCSLHCSAGIYGTVFCVIARNWKSSWVVLCRFELMAILVRGHVAIVMETDFTLCHDQVQFVVWWRRMCTGPSLASLVSSKITCAVKKWSGRRPGNESRCWLLYCLVLVELYHNKWQLQSKCRANSLFRMMPHALFQLLSHRGYLWVLRRTPIVSTFSYSSMINTNAHNVKKVNQQEDTGAHISAMMVSFCTIIVRRCPWDSMHDSDHSIWSESLFTFPEWDDWKYTTVSGT